MKRRKIIIPSVMAIAACSLIVAGTTLATDTSRTSYNFSLTSASLEFTAQATNFNLYSVVPVSDPDHSGLEADEIVYDRDTGLAYAYEKRTDGKFSNGGTVDCDESKNSIGVQNFFPGDKLEFDIYVTNNSNVAATYRTEFMVSAAEASSEDGLLNDLSFTATTTAGNRTVDLGADHKYFEPSEVDDAYVSAVSTDWMRISAKQTSADAVHISIALPVEVTQTSRSLSVYYLVRATQTVTTLNPVAQFMNPNEQTYSTFDTLKEAVEAAEFYGVDTVEIVDSTALEEGTVTVSGPMNFIGIDKDGETPVMSGLRLKLRNQAAVSVTNVDFDGESYIDVTDGARLTMNGCETRVVPTRYYDSIARNFLSQTAFIVSGSSVNAVALDIRNCKFTAAGGSGAAVYLRSVLAGGSLLQQNIFGAENAVYANAVVFGSAMRDASVTVAGNEFYADIPVTVGGTQSASGLEAELFHVLSLENTAHGAKSFALVDSDAKATLTDNGSSADSAAVTLSQIDYRSSLFAGVNVIYNGDGRIVGGNLKIALAYNLNAFVLDYKATEANGRNIRVWLGEDFYTRLDGTLDGDSNYRGSFYIESTAGLAALRQRVTEKENPETFEGCTVYLSHGVSTDGYTDVLAGLNVVELSQ